MKTAVVELDKTWTSEAGETYGTIEIRVVVLSKKPSETGKLGEPDADLDDENEPHGEGRTREPFYDAVQGDRVEPVAQKRHDVAKP